MESHITFRDIEIRTLSATDEEAAELGEREVENWAL